MLQTAQDRFDVVCVLKKHIMISIDGTTTNDYCGCQIFPRRFGNYGANFSGRSPILEPPGSCLDEVFASNNSEGPDVPCGCF